MDVEQGQLELQFTPKGTDTSALLGQASAEGDAKSLEEQLEVLHESIGDIRNGVEASCSTSEEERGPDQGAQRRRSRISLRKACELVQEVVLPVCVVVLGVGFSLAALYVALASALWPDKPSQPDRI